MFEEFSHAYPAMAGTYSGGTGDPNDPYQIATVQDLIALGETPEDYDKHFILTADIDLSDYTFDRAVIAWDGYGIFRNTSSFTSSSITLTQDTSC